MRRILALLHLFLGFRLFAAEVIPPAPAKYFNDYAQVVSADTAARLNQVLENFEKESSDQIIVAVFPRMQSDSSIEDYTIRVFRTWQVGQKARNNGAVLFVFAQDHTIYLQVGYGLEAVLPDALCKRIIAEQIAPRFKAGDFNGGLTAGVQSILAAVKGEYQGTGTTVAGRRGARRLRSSPLDCDPLRGFLRADSVFKTPSLRIPRRRLDHHWRRWRRLVRWRGRRFFRRGWWIFGRWRQRRRRGSGRKLVTMKPPKFIQQLCEKEIVAAIRAAERKTSGEVRVFISHQEDIADPVAAAREQFARLGMEKTRERNAVLIYVAPGPRKFALIGDAGVHARCGDSFWQELARTLTARFRAAEFTEGIVEGITRAGELLAEHFPRRPDDSNELPNRVEHG